MTNARLAEAALSALQATLATFIGQAIAPASISNSRVKTFLSAGNGS
ncbi:MAG: hypothetical protein ACM3ZE_02740 [Myxococcales bacterium]